MNYRRKYNAKRLKVFAPLLLLIVVLALSIFFSSFSLSIPGSSLATTLVRPILIAKVSLGSARGDFFALLRSKRSLVTENQNLKKMLSLYTQQEALFQELLEENRSLKAFLGRDIQEERVLATILIRPNVSFYDTLLVDIGRNKGIKKGDLVITNGEVVIGTVERVDATTSLVSLFSTPGRNVSVLIGDPPVNAEATGRGGGNFEVQLPRGVEVVEGDRVVIPSISPRVFAIVEAISEKESDPFKLILFKTPVNFSELRFVQIIIKES